MKEYMVSVIRRYWYYDEGSLEAMSDEDVKEIFDYLIDWLDGGR